MQSQHILLTNVLTILSFPKEDLSPEMVEKLNLLARNLSSSSDILAYIEQVAEITGTSASMQLEDFTDEINIIIHKLKFIAEQDRPRVLILSLTESAQEFSSAYISDSVGIAGGIAVNLQSAQIDKIIVIDRTQTAFQQLPTLLEQPAIAASNAVAKNEVYVINQADFGQLPGLNYLVELEVLAEIIQPKYFVFGHEGQQWLKFQLV